MGNDTREATEALRTAHRRRNGSTRRWRTIRRYIAITLANAGTLPCTRCGQPVAYGQPFDVDHRLPLAEGGTDTPDNLGPAHPRCNRAHGAQLRNQSQPPPQPSRAW